MRTLLLLPVWVVLLLPGDSAVAQSPRTAPSCAAGQSPFALGIVTTCSDCITHRSRDTASWVHFRATPTVVATEQGFRANGPLRKGDMVLLVDGDDIRTERASRRFSAPPSRDAVRLAIQRGRSALTVTVTPMRVCTER